MLASIFVVVVVVVVLVVMAQNTILSIIAAVKSAIHLW